MYPSNPSTTSTGFVSTIPNINNSNNGVGKIDYHMNDKNTLNGLLVVGNYVGNGEDRGFINQIFSNGFIIKTWTASGAWDYTPTSNMVNEVRFGYNRMTFLTTSGDGAAGTKIAGSEYGIDYGARTANASKSAALLSTARGTTVRKPSRPTRTGMFRIASRTWWASTA